MIYIYIFIQNRFRLFYPCFDSFPNGGQNILLEEYEGDQDKDNRRHRYSKCLTHGTWYLVRTY